MDQIVEMQQVVMEDRLEQEKRQQLEELARTASKVRSRQELPKRNVLDSGWPIVPLID